MEQLDQNKKRENLQKEKNQIFRLLPRVDDLMKKENVQRLAEKEGYERVLGAVRDSVENLRNEISQGIKKGISEQQPGFAGDRGRQRGEGKRHRHSEGNGNCLRHRHEIQFDDAAADFQLRHSVL